MRIITILAWLASATAALGEPHFTWILLDPRDARTYYVALTGWQEADRDRSYYGSVYGVWDDRKQRYLAGGVVEDSFSKDIRNKLVTCVWGDRAALNKAMSQSSFDDNTLDCERIERSSGFNYRRMATDWLDVARFVSTGHGDVALFKLGNGVERK